MDQIRAIERLNSYEQELQAIRSRFTRTHSAIRIGAGDSSRLHQVVIELRDLFQDLFGRNSYSELVVSTYNEGISNHLASPSLNSVERITNIVSAVVTRVKENPGVLKTAPPEVTQQTDPAAPVTQSNGPLAVPETVTLSWLYDHVPHSLWLSVLGLLAAAFALGATAAIKLPIVQQWLGVACKAGGAG
ncbi:hypothetical protein ACFPN1_16200 [Lysobacter yangpyeongensis]|uniref:Uncharacterized protein n=1 Tax=Lysobacter yangpyeongensis TaxID=346182 RepID=A0ABW0SR97_9GAMM